MPKHYTIESFSQSKEGQEQVQQVLNALDENAKEAGLDGTTMYIEYDEEDEIYLIACNYESINTMILYDPKTKRGYYTLMYGDLFGEDVCKVAGRVCKPYKNGMEGVLSDASIWYTG